MDRKHVIRLILQTVFFIQGLRSNPDVTHSPGVKSNPEFREINFEHQIKFDDAVRSDQVSPNDVGIGKSEWVSSAAIFNELRDSALDADGRLPEGRIPFDDPLDSMRSPVHNNEPQIKALLTHILAKNQENDRDVIHRTSALLGQKDLRSLRQGSHTSLPSRIKGRLAGSQNIMKLQNSNIPSSSSPLANNVIPEQNSVRQQKEDSLTTGAFRKSDNKVKITTLSQRLGQNAADTPNVDFVRASLNTAIEKPKSIPALNFLIPSLAPDERLAKTLSEGTQLRQHPQKAGNQRSRHMTNAFMKDTINNIDTPESIPSATSNLLGRTSYAEGNTHSNMRQNSRDPLIESIITKAPSPQLETHSTLKTSSAFNDLLSNQQDGNKLQRLNNIENESAATDSIGQQKRKSKLSKTWSKVRKTIRVLDNVMNPQKSKPPVNSFAFTPSRMAAAETATLKNSSNVRPVVPAADPSLNTAQLKQNILSSVPDENRKAPLSLSKMLLLLGKQIHAKVQTIKNQKIERDQQLVKHHGNSTRRIEKKKLQDIRKQPLHISNERKSNSLKDSINRRINRGFKHPSRRGPKPLTTNPRTLDPSAVTNSIKGNSKQVKSMSRKIDYITADTGKDRQINRSRKPLNSRTSKLHIKGFNHAAKRQRRPQSAKAIKRPDTPRNKGNPVYVPVKSRPEKQDNLPANLLRDRLSDTDQKQDISLKATYKEVMLESATATPDATTQGSASTNTTVIEPIVFDKSFQLRPNDWTKDLNSLFESKLANGEIKPIVAITEAPTYDKNTNQGSYKSLSKEEYKETVLTGNTVGVHLNYRTNNPKRRPNLFQRKQKKIERRIAPRLFENRPMKLGQKTDPSFKNQQKKNWPKHLHQGKRRRKHVRPTKGGGRRKRLRGYLMKNANQKHNRSMKRKHHRARPFKKRHEKKGYNTEGTFKNQLTKIKHFKNRARGRHFDKKSFKVDDTKSAEIATHSKAKETVPLRTKRDIFRVFKRTRNQSVGNTRRRRPPTRRMQYQRQPRNGQDRNSRGNRPPFRQNRRNQAQTNRQQRNRQRQRNISRKGSYRMGSNARRFASGSQRRYRQRGVFRRAEPDNSSKNADTRFIPRRIRKMHREENEPDTTSEEEIELDAQRKRHTLMGENMSDTSSEEDSPDLPRNLELLDRENRPDTSNEEYSTNVNEDSESIDHENEPDTSSEEYSDNLNEDLETLDHEYEQHTLSEENSNTEHEILEPMDRKIKPDTSNEGYSGKVNKYVELRNLENEADTSHNKEVAHELEKLLRLMNRENYPDLFNGEGVNAHKLGKLLRLMNSEHDPDMSTEERKFVPESQQNRRSMEREQPSDTQPQNRGDNITYIAEKTVSLQPSEIPLENLEDPKRSIEKKKIRARPSAVKQRLSADESDTFQNAENQSSQPDEFPPERSVENEKKVSSESEQGTRKSNNIGLASPVKKNQIASIGVQPIPALLQRDDVVVSPRYIAPAQRLPGKKQSFRSQFSSRKQPYTGEENTNERQHTTVDRNAHEVRKNNRGSRGQSFQTRRLGTSQQRILRPEGRRFGTV